MRPSLYFDGRQIKNYLIGFASLFSEIPYKTRRGTIDVVPIHYGSPSDIISYLEMNVDNEATKNRNRLKDISVPMFSFRMIGIERNPEKRRAPHDTITVDLRPLGYSTGYVAMRPTPIRFTMELVCWADSDYQAFEITEQIIPYFNSPQQVIIEPLPRCPVSKTEIFLENVEIDTEPETHRCSAIITMTFTVNGWLLTQPKIWSTNMKFEFQMLDKEYQGPNIPVNLSDTDWSVGHEIIDTNDTLPPSSPIKEKFKSIEEFIKNTNLSEIYGESFDLYNLLIENGRISKDGQLINPTPLEINYKGKKRIIERSLMELLIDNMEDIEFLFENELLKEALKGHTLKDDIEIFNIMIKDDSDILDIYLRLLDKNLATKGFNRTNVPFSNSDKLNMFGTTRIDISEKLERLRMYLAGIENIKIKQSQLLNSGIFDREYKIYTFGLSSIPFEDFPETFKKINDEEVDKTNKNIKYIDFKVHDDKLKIRILPETEIENTLIISIEKENHLVSIEKNLDETIDIELNEIPKEPIVISITPKNNLGFNPIGIMVIKNDEYPDFEDISIVLNNKIFKLTELDFIDNIDKLFDGKKFLNDRFINLDDYIVSTLLLIQVISNKKTTLLESYNSNPNKELYEKLYQGSFKKMISHFGKLKDVIETIKENIDILESSKEEIIDQKQISQDLSQELITDKNGKPIYDVNQDGYINQEDLKILNSEIDNPDDYNFVIRNEIWYKKFDLENISEERIKKIMQDIKILIYLSENKNILFLKDFVILLDKKLVTEDFNIPDSEKKQKEIMIMGYDIQELDNKLLLMRIFVESLKNIIIKEKDYILHILPNLNEESKKLLYNELKLNINKITISKFIDQYFKSDLINAEQKLEDMKLFMKIIPDIMKEFTIFSYQFDIFIEDLKKSEFFIESLKIEIPWLSEKLPDVDKIIKEKYLKK